jgi:succinate dehydrogenase/fumarate reductase flavoprotein subunit
MSGRGDPARGGARALAASLDRASYAGYVAGFEAARDAAAALARAARAPALAEAIAALAPLPDRGRDDPGRA